jgi:hypothetical protein
MDTVANSGKKPTAAEARERTEHVAAQVAALATEVTALKEHAAVQRRELAVLTDANTEMRHDLAGLKRQVSDAATPTSGTGAASGTPATTPATGRKAAASRNMLPDNGMVRIAAPRGPPPRPKKISTQKGTST